MNLKQEGLGAIRTITAMNLKHAGADAIRPYLFQIQKPLNFKVKTKSFTGNEIQFP